jgi:hypothetical protein
MLEYASGTQAASTGWESHAFPSFPWPALKESDRLQRWIRGHHVFLIIIQGLILSLNCFESAQLSHQAGTSASSLQLATLLMEGANAALHYAADFPAVDYDKSVRPTMMPPHVPAGMSGVLARDHRYLLQLLHGRRELFASLEPNLHREYQEFVAAFGGAYDAHKIVCAHFRGDERPSLLNTDAQQTGVELLEELKHSRINSFVTEDVCVAKT